jgi:6-phosphogluconolactonase (cycloisomerase 2 family)
MGAALLACGTGILRAQDAGTPHVVITDNDVYRAPNSAAVFQLSGSTLRSSTALSTTGWGISTGFFGTNEQAVATVGTTVCTFVSDPGSDDIAAFNTTNFAAPRLVGNYVDLTGSGAYTGIALAARGSLLIAGYSASVNIGVWTINSDCSLTSSSAASNNPLEAPVNDLAISPNGSTLIVTFGQTTPGVDSFAITGTTLTKKGSYNTTGNTAGIDITKDSKYLLIGDYSLASTEIDLFPINSDSTLGTEDYYLTSGGGADSNNVWLSPDETVLYVSNNVGFQVTTLRFSETAAAGHRLAFACISSILKNPIGGTIYYTGSMATESGTGKGGYLYVAEYGNPSAVALLQIPANGCPAEVSGSPFTNSAIGFPVTLVAYPSRPF